MLSLLSKEGLKICTNDHGLISKMAAMHIYGEKKKDFKIVFSRTKKALRLNLGIQLPSKFLGLPALAPRLCTCIKS